MQDDNKINNDFDLASLSNDDLDFEDLFKDKKDEDILNEDNKKQEAQEVVELKEEEKKYIDKKSPTQAVQQSQKAKSETKKRTIFDFEPDMDMILMTAQSSMIVEGMKCYTKKDFSAKTLQVYIEARKGVELYIKILDRNPSNYRNLKTLIDADTDCQSVERIAFNLFKKANDVLPETDKEKIEAFELLQALLKESVEKATISKSIKLLQKYFLISGGLNVELIARKNKEDDTGFKTDLKFFQQHLKLALDMQKRGKGEIADGLKGRDLNMYIIRCTELFIHYYKLIGDERNEEYYTRIYNINRKYFLIKE